MLNYGLHTDKQTDNHTDTQTDSHTDTETDRNTGKQHTDTQTHTDKYTDRQTTSSHRQNGYKVPKMLKNFLKRVKNIFDKLKMCVNWIPLVNATLSPIPNTWCVSKNGPERAK